MKFSCTSILLFYVPSKYHTSHLPELYRRTNIRSQWANWVPTNRDPDISGSLRPCQWWPSLLERAPNTSVHSYIGFKSFCGVCWGSLPLASFLSSWLCKQTKDDVPELFCFGLRFSRSVVRSCGLSSLPNGVFLHGHQSWWNVARCFGPWLESVFVTRTFLLRSTAMDPRFKGTWGLRFHFVYVFLTRLLFL